MAGDKGLRVPADKAHPSRRLTGNLAVGKAYNNGDILWGVIPIFGSQRVAVRFKGTAAGALDLVFTGPDFADGQDPATAFAALVGTLYTAGNPAQVAVVANVASLIATALNGESFLIVKFTASATGVVTYCDVATLALSNMSS